MKSRFITWWLLTFNRLLGEHGQNAYCLKSEVKLLVMSVGHHYRQNPVARQRFQELLDAIDDLKA